jgi:hypothetical protein
VEVLSPRGSKASQQPRLKPARFLWRKKLPPRKWHQRKPLNGIREDNSGLKKMPILVVLAFQV